MALTKDRGSVRRGDHGHRSLVGRSGARPIRAGVPRERNRRTGAAEPDCRRSQWESTMLNFCGVGCDRPAGLPLTAAIPEIAKGSPDSTPKAVARAVSRLRALLPQTGALPRLWCYTQFAKATCGTIRLKLLNLIRWNVDKFRHPSNRPSQSENLRRDLRTAYRLVAREDELASGPASSGHESRAAVMRAFWVRCCRRTSKHLCGPRRTLLHRVE